MESTSEVRYRRAEERDYGAADPFQPNFEEETNNVMAEFTIIKESDAPRPTRQSGRLASRMREYEKYADAVPAGKVGKLVPSRGETARGLSLRISRAAKRTHKSINTWMLDDVVYFSIG